MLKRWFLISLLIISQFSVAQEGSWYPAEADLSYPRTMLKYSEVEIIQTTLQHEPVQSLYSGVCSSAFSGIPGNTNSSDRRIRAGIAKNAGFVILLDRKIASGNAVALTTTERASLQDKVVGLLEQINPDVQTLIYFPEWQWRSKELIDYSIAYDMLKGTGIPDEQLINAKLKLQQFAGNLYRESTSELSGISLFNNIKNNHSLMTAAALGIAAVVLNDLKHTDENFQPRKWIDAAMWNIDNVIWRDEKRQSEPGIVAGFAEGPYYFRYAFINCLPFFRAMGNFQGDHVESYSFNGIIRNIRNPFFNPDYDNLYDWMRIIRMPDGRMPALDDSYIDMAMPELALTGKSKFHWPLDLQNLHTSQNNTLDKQLRVVVDLRSNYIAANTPMALFEDKKFHPLPISGNIVFRSSWNTEATYMHLQAESGRALSETDGHNQADETNFIIHSHGQLLALDPGYLSWARREELANAQNHNMILVNGTGPKFGIPGETNGADVFVKEAFSVDDFSTSKISTSYGGADISRRVMFIRNKYFIVVDSLSSSSPSDYQWQLHGYGLENGTSTTGTFIKNTNEQKGHYLKNGVTLLAQVTAENGISSFQTRQDQHELGYNRTEDHTTMVFSKNNVNNTAFLSLLAPYIQENISSKIISGSSAAISIRDEDFNDFTFSRTATETVKFSETETELQYDIESDAATLYISETKTGQLVEYYFTNGSRFIRNEEELVVSDNNINLYWRKTDENLFTIQTNKAALLKMQFDHEVYSISGNKISSWNYDITNKTLTIAFNDASTAAVEFNILSLPVVFLNFKAVLRNNNHLELQWSTASERNNDFFDVERSHDALHWFKIGSVKGSGTSGKILNYTFDDKMLPKHVQKIFYRLKQVDYNGTFNYSGILEVPYKTSKPVKSLSIHPNPGSDYVFIHIEDKEYRDLTLMLINGNGQIVKEFSITGNTWLDIRNIPKGIYMVKYLNRESSPSTERLIVN